jgi:hypothetical protein
MRSFAVRRTAAMKLTSTDYLLIALLSAGCGATLLMIAWEKIRKGPRG